MKRFRMSIPMEGYVTVSAVDAEDAVKQAEILRAAMTDWENVAAITLDVADAEPVEGLNSQDIEGDVYVVFDSTPCNLVDELGDAPPVGLDGEYEDVEDDDGCPLDDPECEGRNGDCHDACERPADRAIQRLADQS